MANAFEEEIKRRLSALEEKVGDLQMQVNNNAIEVNKQLRIIRNKLLRITDTKNILINYEKIEALKEHFRVLKVRFDKEEDIRMAREKDIYERLEALESILERFLGIISQESLEYKDAVPKYKALLKQLEGKQ